MGERRVTTLFERYGLPELLERFDALLDYTERLARQAIAALPDGEYTFTDYLDDDGFDPGPIPITVAVRVHGDSITADFTGTAPQVRGGINSPIPFSRSAVYACVRCLLGEEVPNNEGYFRPIEVIAPPGTIVNPRMPAPVAARGLTGFRIANAVLGALAQLAPERIPACEMGGDTGVSIGGYDASGTPFVYLEFLYGSSGGRPWGDGTDGLTSIVVNFSNNPVEVVESELPLRLERYGYVPDSEGAGQYRGGLSLVREYRCWKRRPRSSSAPTATSTSPTAWPVDKPAPQRKTSSIPTVPPKSCRASPRSPSAATTCFATPRPAPAAGATRWSATRRWSWPMSATRKSPANAPAASTASRSPPPATLTGPPPSSYAPSRRGACNRCCARPPAAAGPFVATLVWIVPGASMAAFPGPFG